MSPKHVHEMSPKSGHEMSPLMSTRCHLLCPRDVCHPCSLQKSLLKLVTIIMTITASRFLTKLCAIYGSLQMRSRASCKVKAVANVPWGMMIEFMAYGTYTCHHFCKVIYAQVLKSLPNKKGPKNLGYPPKKQSFYKEKDCFFVGYPKFFWPILFLSVFSVNE